MARLAPKLKFFLPAAVAVALVPTTAMAVVVGTRQTGHLTPQSGTGGAPDGNSDNLTFSQDNRVVKFAAFDTSATNLAPGDTNGKRDVILFRRSGGAGNLGGAMELASVSSQGIQGNGDSRKPRLDGSARSASHCLVFESESTNLDPRDTTPDTDVFLRDLKTRTTTLASLNDDGTDPDVDGSCKAVVFSSAGKVMLYDVAKRNLFQIGSGTNPDIQNNGKGAAYERDGQIYYQAFQFINRMKGGKRVFFWTKIGKEQLVSRSKSGAPGDGVSANPGMDDNGYYVSFESDATNLCTNACVGISSDTNGVRDIFRRTLPKRPGAKSSAPTKDFMEMASFSCGASKKGARCQVNQQGNGPSTNAFMTGAGENIVYQSEATNLKESTGIRIADLNGPVSDIYYWNFPRGRMVGNVSRESRTNTSRSNDAFDAPATKPAASNRANYIGWTSPGGTDLTSGVKVPEGLQPHAPPPDPSIPPTVPCVIASAVPVGVTVPQTTLPCPAGSKPSGTLAFIGATPNPALKEQTPIYGTGVDALFIRFLGGSGEGRDTN